MEGGVGVFARATTKEEVDVCANETDKKLARERYNFLGWFWAAVSYICGFLYRNEQLIWRPGRALKPAVVLSSRADSRPRRFSYCSRYLRDVRHYVSPIEQTELFTVDKVM